MLSKALKVISKSGVKNPERIMTEKQVLSELNGSPSEHVVKLYTTFKDDHNLYFLTDAVEGGPLFKQIKSLNCLSIEKTRFYVAEIILALEHLHSLGWVYRDLKASNVMLRRDGHICLVDLGFAKKITSSGRAHSFLGTPHAMAPEIISRIEGGYSYPVDLW